MDGFLFDDATMVLAEATERHRAVLAYAVEAIDLAHIAYGRVRDATAMWVPGIPHIRRVRNDISDDSWRFMRSIADPLLADGLIRRFDNIAGGDVMVMPDGMVCRIKKGTPSGETSNYPTGKVLAQGAAADHAILFSAATPLDVAIQDGVMFDVVFIAGEVMGEYRHVGLRFAMAEISPFHTLEQASNEQLKAISPTAFDIASGARMKLAG